MKEYGSRTIPAELSRAAARLDEWRRQRVKGERIPAPLWNMVLDLARRYGVSRTATTVRIGYYGLKKRLAAAVSLVDPQHSTSTTSFVELPSITTPTIMPGECVIEWDRSAGTKVRVQVKGALPDLVVLVRSLWESE